VSADELLDHFALLKGVGERPARRQVVEALLRQTNLWAARQGSVEAALRQTLELLPTAIRAL